MFDKFFRKKNVLRGFEIEDSIMTITQKEKAIIEMPFKRKGLETIWFFILFIIILLAGRVAYLDVIKGNYYSDVSKGNRIRLSAIKAPRGKILDKFGNILVGNTPSMDVVVVPYDLPNDLIERGKVAKIVANVLNMELGNVETALEAHNKKSLDPVLLKENITQDQALILAEKAKEIPGINVENTAIRSYENGMIFSTVIGYDGKITREELKNNKEYAFTDYIGKTGLEKYYEKELKGKNGAKQVEVDSMGRVKKNLGTINPEAGNDLILNIDEGLQKKLYDSITATLERTNTKVATAVAIDPRNGGVLAMVSVPSFDNNLFARGISNDDYKNITENKNLPLLNRAIKGEYPPGSTFKPAVAAAALTEKIISSDTTVSDNNGAINIGSFRFGDWKTHGVVDVRKAIAESCDVFFYAIGGGYGNIQGLGIDRIKKYANLFGMGSPTGIDLPGELSGLIPDEQWKKNKIKERWYIGDSYHSAIGQGFITTTPLQVVNFIASIANGGTLYKPRIVNRIQNNKGEIKNFSPEVIRKDFISPEVLRIVREGMRQTVESGTAQPLKDLSVAVAGKTGTAQFGADGKTHGWFVSFAPYDNPEIAMVVLAEGGGEGHSTGVPITKEVYQWYFSKER